MGRFDYPSPYWDPVGDPALDLIDRMLTVDVHKRITIDECLEHPWVTQREFVSLGDSTDGLTGAMGQLDFQRRSGVQRERTLLSNINDVKVSRVVQVDGSKLNGKPEGDAEPVKVKVWEKNPAGKNERMSPAKEKNGDVGTAHTTKGKENEASEKKDDENEKNDVANDAKTEEDPAANRAPEEFSAMGGKGDQALFAEDTSSRYLPEEVPATNGPSS